MAAARMLVHAALATLLAAGLVGCSSDASEPEPDPTGTTASGSPTEPEQRVELTVAVYGNQLRLTAYQRIASAFEKAEPGVTISLETYPDADTAGDLAATALELGGGGPDVFLVDQRDLPRLAATGGLEPVDVPLEERGLEFGDDFQRVALTAFSADNRLQCMPAEMSPLVVYYNKRLVPRRALLAAGIEIPNANDTSWTWDEFETTARTVAGADLLGPIKGVHIPADIETLTALVRSAELDVVDDIYQPTTLTLSTEGSLEAISEVAGLARDPAVSLTRQELRRRPAVEWFASGQLGMLIGTRDDLPLLREAKGLRFDVVPLPAMGRTRSVSTINGYCLNGASEEKDAASDFIAFAVGPEGAEIAARSEVIVPASLDVVHDDVFTEPGQQPRNSHVFATSQRRSDQMPDSAAWPLVGAEVEAVIGRLFRHPEIDLDATLEEQMVRLEERSVQLFAEADTLDDAGSGSE